MNETVRLAQEKRAQQQQQICPVMSRPVVSRVVGAPGTFEGFTPCVGPRCALWIPNINEVGETIGGSCAHLALPSVLSQVTRIMHFAAMEKVPSYNEAISAPMKEEAPQ